MVKAFFISRQGRQEGPHSLELIEDKIKSRYFQEKDYIYDAKSGEWLHLGKFKFTKEIFENLMMEEMETKTHGAEIQDIDNNWYLLKDNKQLGPYHYKEIISMLINKNAYEYDYVWSPGMSHWQKVSDCQQFQEGKLLPFAKKESYSSSLHFRRRSARKDFGTSLVFHNNQKLWNALSFEISETGASIEVTDPSIKKGEIILIHYRPSKSVPAFNVKCEVMSCEKIKGNLNHFRLGLRFIKINEVAQTALRQWVTHQVAS